MRASTSSSSDGLGRRHGAVVDITGNQHGVRTHVAHERHELIEHMGLILDQAAGMKKPAKMPVGGVEKTQFGSFGAVVRKARQKPCGPA